MNPFATFAVSALLTGVLMAWVRPGEQPEDKSTASPAETKAAEKKTETWDGKKVVKTAAEWAKQLTRQQFAVTRRGKTEPAFRNKYWENKRKGTYRCVCCGLPLFESSAKFASGTGWPSFFKPIEKTHLEYEKDLSQRMTRIEVKCCRCDAHLGHVFGDGPRPTGLRYCINSAALDFKAETAKPNNQANAKEDRPRKAGRSP